MFGPLRGHPPFTVIGLRLDNIQSKERIRGLSTLRLWHLVLDRVVVLFRMAERSYSTCMCSDRCPASPFQVLPVHNPHCAK